MDISFKKETERGRKKKKTKKNDVPKDVREEEAGKVYVDIQRQ